MTAWHNRQRTAGALLSLSLVGGAALSAGALAPTPTPLAPPRAVTLSVGWVTAPAPGPTTESAVTNQNGASAASRPASEPTPEPAPEPTATPASEPMPNAAPEPVAKTQVAAPLTPNTFPKPANRRERPPRKEQPARPVEQPVVARQTSSIATSALVPPIPSKKAPPADAETAAEPTPSATLEAHPAAATHGNDPAAAAAAPLAAPSPAAPAPTPPEPANAELKVFCTHRPPPPYPLVARRLGIEGVVTLRVTLTGAGTIVAAEIDRERSSTDHPALTAAALKAVRQWRCALPRAFQDRTVTVWQPFRFQLHSG